MPILTKKDCGDRIVLVMSPYIISKNGELCNAFPIMIIEKKTKKIIAEFDLTHSLPNNEFQIEDIVGKDKEGINEYFAKAQKQNQIQIEKTADELADIASKFIIS